jgi:hypothetical protein
LNDRSPPAFIKRVVRAQSYGREAFLVASDAAVTSCVTANPSPRAARVRWRGDRHSPAILGEELPIMKAFDIMGAPDGPLVSEKRM